VPPPPLAESLAAAAAVFEGRPTRGSSTASDSVYGALVEYRFTVSRRWKGEVPAEVSVWTPSSDAACGRPFEDAPHLVFASMREGRLMVSLCSATTVITAATDLGALGPPLPPAEAAAAAPHEGCAVGPGAPLAPAALVMVVVALALRRRR
jgi:MYXO-CTERM domain-containing protein